MNIKASFLYQLYSHKRSVLIYYFVIVCLIAFFFVSSLMLSGESQFGGMDMITGIFLFVSGLCAFKEAFCMLMQNGISRKSMFVGRILATAALAFALTVIDTVFCLIQKCLTLLSSGYTSVTMYEQLYYERTGRQGALQNGFENFLFDLFLYLSLIAVGYFITVLYYRMGTGGKIAVSIGVPAFFIIFPSIDYNLTGGKASTAIGRFILTATGADTQNPYAIFVTFIVVFAAFSLFSWLLMKKATIKQ